MATIAVTMVKKNKPLKVYTTPVAITLNPEFIEYATIDPDPVNSGGTYIEYSEPGKRMTVYQVSESLAVVLAAANAVFANLIQVLMKKLDKRTFGSGAHQDQAVVTAKVKVESFAPVAAGTKYRVGDILSLSGGTGTAATVTLTRVKPINAQTQTSYDNSPTTEGSFVGGTGHANADVITLADGTTITVVANAGGVVTQFTVNSAASTGSTTNGATIAQASTTGSGIGFTLTLDTDTQALHTVTLTTAGSYSAVHTDIANVATTGSATGTGATFSIDYEVDSLVIADAGAGYSSVTFTISGGGGTGATATGTVSAGAVTGTTVTAPGNNFTGIPSVAVSAPNATIIGKYALIAAHQIWSVEEAEGATQRKIVLARRHGKPTVINANESQAAIVSAANATAGRNILTNYTVYGINKRPFGSARTRVISLNDQFYIDKRVNAGTGNDYVKYMAANFDNIGDPVIFSI